MMKTNKYPQYSIVSESDTASFQEKLNAELMRLMDKNPEVEITEGKSFLARIKYQETRDLFVEDVTQKGITFTCGDCPVFIPRAKTDGTPDLRSKYGDCPHAEMHRTWKTASACENLYMMIRNGDIQLTLAKDRNDESIVLIPAGRSGK